METPTKEILSHLDFSDRLLSVARSQVGLAEIPKGSNWGKNVQKYLAAVDINFAAPWCMGYTYWCVNEACKEMGMPNPLVKTGSVMKQWHDIPAALKTDKPKRGSIFIMDFGKGLGHTGIVENVNNIGTINTIEGNSNDEGSREGYEVCRRIRNIKSCIGFITIS